MHPFFDVLLGISLVLLALTWLGMWLQTVFKRATRVLRLVRQHSP
jgi:hypothetical protein